MSGTFSAASTGGGVRKQARLRCGDDLETTPGDDGCGDETASSSGPRFEERHRRSSPQAAALICCSRESIEPTNKETNKQTNRSPHRCVRSKLYIRTRIDWARFVALTVVYSQIVCREGRGRLRSWRFWHWLLSALIIFALISRSNNARSSIGLKKKHLISQVSGAS